ncbi:hypothetical protein PG985_012812 [Apiospora marii]|uniref:Uncharacterized protein n=1 Tax=Apiospora marii TaxID=335849 RepID=A0ABR1REA9_9PEZI
MNFEYTHPEGRPTDPFEVAVLEAGYKWVRTNTIVATRPGEFKPDLPVDRLNPHRHSGHNTHLIVAGDLRFAIEQDYYDEAAFKRKRTPPRVKTAELEAADPDARKEFYAAREHRYKATSQSGCSFVEGHRCLSPTTAERFMARETLRAVPLADSEGEGEGKDEDETHWPSQDEIRDLLHRAKWYPRGVPSLDNFGKPEMIWEEDAGVEKPRTLRNGKVRPEMNPTEDKTGSEGGEKATNKEKDGKRESKDTPAFASVKKMLADWFKEEWDDHRRTSHCEPQSVRYDDLYYYDAHEEPDDDMTEADDMQDDTQEHEEKAGQRTCKDLKTTRMEEDEVSEMEDI